MATQYHISKLRPVTTGSVKLGVQPFNRDNIALAFGKHAKVKDGQELAGTGALVFEGEVLEIANWN